MFAWLVLLSLAVLIGLVFFLYTVTTQHITRQAINQFEARYRAADQIINDERVPDAWIQDYRLQIQEIEVRGGSEVEIERVGKRARNELLKQIHNLYRLFEAGNYYDSPSTKYTVLEELRERELQWAARTWQDLLTTRPNQTDTDREPAAVEQPGERDDINS